MFYNPQKTDFFFSDNDSYIKEVNKIARPRDSQPTKKLKTDL